LKKADIETEETETEEEEEEEKRLQKFHRNSCLHLGKDNL